MSIRFEPESALCKALAEFWDLLKKNPGMRAELKRCRDVSEVMLTPHYHHVCQRIKGVMAGERHWEVRLAAIVGLMSHLKRDDPSRVLSAGKGNEKSFAGSFVVPMAQLEGDRPKVSELRFRRLLQREFAELYPALVRVIKMLGGDVSLYGLAESVYYWDWGDRVKKEWSFAYFPKVPQRKSA